MKTFQTQVYYKRNRKEVNATVEFDKRLNIKVMYDDMDISGNIPSYQLDNIRNQCRSIIVKEWTQSLVSNLNYTSTLS